MKATAMQDEQWREECTGTQYLYAHCLCSSTKWNSVYNLSDVLLWLHLGAIVCRQRSITIRSTFVLFFIIYYLWLCKLQ